MNVALVTAMITSAATNNRLAAKPSARTAHGRRAQAYAEAEALAAPILADLPKDRTALLRVHSEMSAYHKRCQTQHDLAADAYEAGKGDHYRARAYRWFAQGHAAYLVAVECWERATGEKARRIGGRA